MTQAIRTIIKNYKWRIFWVDRRFRFFQIGLYPKFITSVSEIEDLAFACLIHNNLQIMLWLLLSRPSKFKYICYAHFDLKYNLKLFYDKIELYQNFS